MKAGNFEASGREEGFEAWAPVRCGGTAVVERVAAADRDQMLLLDEGSPMRKPALSGRDTPRREAELGVYAVAGV